MTILDHTPTRTRFKLPRGNLNHLRIAAFILVLLLVGSHPRFVQAAGILTEPGNPEETAGGNLSGLPDKGELPRLSEFVREIQNGDGALLVGVYVPGLMAYPVAQQPASQPGFVLNQAGYVTQFRLAAQYNTIGLLAHNDLAGMEFFQLQGSQEVILVYGDGSLDYYQISEVSYFQALSPTSPYSDFLEIGKSEPQLSVVELFNQIYATGSQLVFQTCIAANGVSTWGRLFVTAVPVERDVPRISRMRISMTVLE